MLSTPNLIQLSGLPRGEPKIIWLRTTTKIKDKGVSLSPFIKVTEAYVTVNISYKDILTQQMSEIFKSNKVHGLDADMNLAIQTGNLPFGNYVKNSEIFIEHKGKVYMRYYILPTSNVQVQYYYPRNYHPISPLEELVLGSKIPKHRLQFLSPKKGKPPFLGIRVRNVDIRHIDAVRFSNVEE